MKGSILGVSRRNREEMVSVIVRSKKLQMKKPHNGAQQIRPNGGPGRCVGRSPNRDLPWRKRGPE